MARVTTRLVKLRAACEALACSRRTFWRHWHGVFTDPRPADRGPREERRVLEDELAAAIEGGRAAVLTYRALAGRTRAPGGGS